MGVLKWKRIGVGPYPDDWSSSSKGEVFLTIFHVSCWACKFCRTADAESPVSPAEISSEVDSFSLLHWVGGRWPYHVWCFVPQLGTIVVMNNSSMKISAGRCVHSTHFKTELKLNIAKRGEKKEVKKYICPLRQEIKKKTNGTWKHKYPTCCVIVAQKQVSKSIHEDEKQLSKDTGEETWHSIPIIPKRLREVLWSVFRVARGYTIRKLLYSVISWL